MNVSLFFLYKHNAPLFFASCFIVKSPPNLLGSVDY